MTDLAQSNLEQAWRSGRFVDASDGDISGSIDAEVIRRFCTAGRDAVDPRGILLRNANIIGQLDLAGVEVPFPLRFESCSFETAPLLDGARLNEFACVDATHLPGLLANGVTVLRDLDLSGSRISGGHRTSASTSMSAAVWLCEADIGGRLLANATTLRNDGGRALQADRLRVGGTVRLMRGFHAHGEVRLIGARIGGSLHLSGFTIESDTTYALSLGDADIGGALFLLDNPGGSGALVRGRVDLHNARVSGQLLIRGADLAPATPDDGLCISARRITVGAGIAIRSATRFAGTVDLSASDLGGLTVEADCRFAAPGHIALDLTTAELRSSLTLAEGARLRGTLRLIGAHVRGSLHLVGVDLTEPQGLSLLTADGIVVDGNVDLSRLRATGGRLKFWRARIDGGLDATGAQLSNEAECTLRLHQSTVGGSVRLVDGFSSVGYVLLNRSTIEGRLDCRRGTFAGGQVSVLNPDGHAIQAIATTIRGGMHLGWTAVSPSVDFTDASTSVLEDDPRTWPARFTIAGFRYDRFDTLGRTTRANVWDWRQRREWLKRQAHHDAGPYEQAARVFRQHGYVYGAEQILIAQRTQARKSIRGHQLRPRSWLDAISGWSVGYGYRPGRVLWLLALLLVLVSLSLYDERAQSTMRATDEAGDVYGITGLLVRGDGQATAPPPTNPCGNGQVRCFRPVLYAIDTVMPLVTLDQRDTWYPNSEAPFGRFMEWWLNMAAVAGWLLSSIFLLSFARVARSL